jgi:hypothetical protein
MCTLVVLLSSESSKKKANETPQTLLHSSTPYISGTHLRYMLSAIGPQQMNNKTIESPLDIAAIPKIISLLIAVIIRERSTRKKRK